MTHVCRWLFLFVLIWCNSAFATEIDTVYGIELVSIKGGCVRMGDSSGDVYRTAAPVHQVCIDDFSMGIFEITQGQWRMVMGNNPSLFIACGDDCPVENVSFKDVQEFLTKLSRMTARKYRLPTEAEWEFACREGGKEEKFCGGNDADVLAWYDTNSGGKTHRVGSKQPNALGLYDMSGNVEEWVSDGFEWYSGENSTNPRGPSHPFSRVVRGGSWYHDQGYAKGASRNHVDSGLHINTIGFRIVSAP